jgi:hypothetical protein
VPPTSIISSLHIRFSSGTVSSSSQIIVGAAITCTIVGATACATSCTAACMAGPGNDPVQVYRTKRVLHWEFLRLRTGFELSSSWTALPAYGSNLNRNILDFMRWPQIGLGAQDINGIQRPKSFQKNSWK